MAKLDGTILKLAHSYRDSEELLKAVRKEHPESSKRDIILAAFNVMIQAAGSGDGIARKLHRMAMDHRGNT